MDSWPPIRTPRFDGESENAFRRRADRISEIINAFRFGRHGTSEGEELEQELLSLQNPGYYIHREAAALH